MRIAFFLLVFANLVFFVWAQGYLGGQETGREPQRLADQLHPDKLKFAVRESRAAPREVCRLVDGLAAADAEQLQKALREAGNGIAVTLRTAEEKPAWWVSINALPTKVAADKKAGELKLLGVTDFHVLQGDGGSFAVSLGVFDSEAAANEFLQGLNRKGVKSARLEPRAKPATAARLEVRGPADVVAKRLPELLAGVVGASASDCP